MVLAGEGDEKEDEKNEKTYLFLLRNVMSVPPPPSTIDDEEKTYRRVPSQSDREEARLRASAGRKA